MHLELGGNSALIVLDDVDLEKAVSVGAFGSFNHAGQICMATSRHLVAASIADDYAAALAEHAEPAAGRRPGRRQCRPSGRSSTPNNATTSTASSPRSVDQGARLAAGGTYEGLFYRPTVLTDVPLTAPAYAEEIFGPVAPVVPFADLDEAVRLAGGTEYGLSLGILTRDVMKGLALAERIPSGLVHINDQTVNDEALIPVRRRGRIRHRVAARRQRGQSRRLHQRPMGHHARRPAAVSVLSRHPSLIGGEHHD